MQNFENSVDWVTLGMTENDSSRWKIRIPNESKIKSGNYAWFTKIPVVTGNTSKEYSQVVSSCFDLSELKRPMIKMKIWPSLDNNFGAVLQFSRIWSSTWETAKWESLGTLNEGINWYNSSSIQNLNLESFIGWTGNNYSNWIDVRHNLNTLKDSSKVRFRIVYSAESKLVTGTDGFAFDDVWIGERQQMQVLEYFTN